MPTGNIVSDKWFIRVTITGRVFFELYNSHRVNFIDHVRVFAVSHVGQRTEKEHVHLIVELTGTLQKQSVDKRYKRVFGVCGADYASKPWDGDMGAGAGSYMFHDPNVVPLIIQGFTDEEIENFKRCNAEVQKVVEVNKQRASGRCVERMLAKIAESNREWTRREVAKALLTDIREGVMYEPGDYVLRRYIEEIYGKQFKGAQWEHYVDVRIGNLVRQEDTEIVRPWE